MLGFDFISDLLRTGRGSSGSAVAFFLGFLEPKLFETSGSRRMVGLHKRLYYVCFKHLHVRVDRSETEMV